jgi:hypothetical protein
MSRQVFIPHHSINHTERPVFGLTDGKRRLGGMPTLSHEGGIAMSGVGGGYGATAAFVLVLFILLVIILRAGIWY